MIKFNQAWMEKEGGKKMFLRQSKGNRRKILALVCKACVGEEHAEVRRHPTARAVRGRVTSQRDQIFRTASARVASCPDRRKGRAERGARPRGLAARRAAGRSAGTAGARLVCAPGRPPM